MTTSIEDPLCTVEYSQGEEKVVANIIHQMKERCYGQQFILQRGLKEFPVDGPKVAKEELAQLRLRKGFRAIAVRELTRQEREQAMEGLMFIQEKRSGRKKGDNYTSCSAPKMH